MVNFGSSSYWDTTSTNGGNLTNGFDIKDFTVPSVLNGVTARIYIGVKVNGNTKNLHDYGIAGLQILDLTQSNSYNKVQRAMAIRGLVQQINLGNNQTLSIMKHLLVILKLLICSIALQTMAIL